MAEAIEEARALGVDPASFGLGGEAEAPQDDEDLWPWHLPALEAWTVVAGQMRGVVVGGGMGPGRLVWLGLEAAGAKAALDLAGVTLAEGAWDMLQAIAAGAAEELNR